MSYIHRHTHTAHMHVFHTYKHIRIGHTCMNIIRTYPSAYRKHACMCMCMCNSVCMHVCMHHIAPAYKRSDDENDGDDAGSGVGYGGKKL